MCSLLRIAFRWWEPSREQRVQPGNQLLDDRCDCGGGPLSSHAARLSVPADRRGCGTAHVGTPRRGKTHTCKLHQRARTPTSISQSMA
jgi:hypothetical protein